MSQITFPKLSELTSTIKEPISAAVGALATENGKKILVIVDDGLQKNRIENQLKKKGFVIVVEPVLECKLRDQSGKAWIGDVELMVKVLCNPERNSETDTGGVGANIYAIVSLVVDAVCGKGRHQGGEFFRFVGFALSKFDEGLWVYDLTFTKESFEL